MSQNKTYFFYQMLQGINKNFFRDGIIILLVLFVLLAAMLASDKDSVLAPALEIFLLFYAAYTGWAMFERERQEKAEEYMLSLPVSRTRLFFLKFLPRTAAAGIVLAFYLLLQQFFNFPFLLDIVDFSLTYAVLFLLAMAFSLSIKSFVTVFLLSCTLTLGQAFYLKLQDRTLSESDALLRADLTVLVFPVLFFILFHLYDIKPIAYFNRKFAPPAVILTVVIAVAAYFSSAPTWNNYVLLDSGGVVRFKCEKTEIIPLREPGEKSAAYRFKGCVFPLHAENREQGNFLYAVRRVRQEKGCSLTALISINLKTGVERLICDLPEGWYLSRGDLGKIGKIKDGTFYMVLQNDDRMLMLMSIRGQKVEQAPVSGDLQGGWVDRLLLVTDAPRQYFVLAGPVVYRIDASGAAEQLFRAEALALWKDKLLRFDKKTGLTLYRIGTGLTPIFQKKGAFKKIKRSRGVHESRLVIFKSGSDFFMLDLEKEGEPVKIDIEVSPFYYFVREGRYILLFRDPRGVTAVELKDGKLTGKREWQPTIEYKYNTMDVSAYGVMVYNPHEYEVFSF